MVYLGSSMVKSAPATMAWQLRRELGSRPQARSSRSSSVSSSSLRLLKPWRTTTWQVVQAQLMSQACSISMWFFSRASHTEVPGLAVISAPCGHSSAWGRILMMGMGSNLINVAARQGLADAAVHALGGKGFGALGQRLGGGFEHRQFTPVAAVAHLRHQLVNVCALLGAEQIAVGSQCGAGGFQHALGFHAGFAQGAVLHVGGRSREAL